MILVSFLSQAASAKLNLCMLVKILQVRMDEGV